MVAKDLHEALLKAQIKERIIELLVGPMSDIPGRLDEVVEKTTQDILGQLRDYFAHKAMSIDFTRSEVDHKAVIKFFNDCFKGVGMNGSKE
jgi:hypothetical protein